MLDFRRHPAAVATDDGAVVADEHCSVLDASPTLCQGSSAAVRRSPRRDLARDPEHVSGAGSV
jgi:hypothetical protein